MADIMGLAASAASGGIFGLIGTALGRVAGYFEQRQSMSHEKNRWAHEVKLLEMQRLVSLEEAEARREQTEIEGSWQGLESSLKAEASIGPSYKWVNAVRALTRPVLTLLLWGISSGIWIYADLEGRATITETATFAATAATLWWFGDRGARRE